MADQPDQLATFTEDAPRAELVQQPVDQQPDITKHRPNDYAALTAQQALQTTYGQGLMPTREQIFGIYDQALKDANQFHSHLAEQQASAITELQKRQQALPILAAEKATEASVQEQQKQFEQGAGAVAQAKQQGGSGLVQRLGPDDLTKLDAFATSYNSVNDLGQYFNKMMEKPHLGVGGQWKSLAGKMRLFADATSPEALAFDRARESSIVPVGRGVMGETGASPTKESMIQIAEALNLPRIQDDEETGNQGIFMLKKRIMQNLQAFRDDRYNAGFDTTSIDRQIGKLNSDFASDNTQKWDPLRTAPIVQAGTSAQADATIANVNAGANKGVQVTQSGSQQQPAMVAPPGWPSGGTQTAQTTQATTSQSTVPEALQTSTGAMTAPPAWGQVSMPGAASIATPSQQAAVEQRWQQAQQLPSKTWNWLTGWLPENRYSQGMPARQF